MHPIDEASPLFGHTPQSLLDQDTELQVMMVGLDDTSMQIVHASHRYFANQSHRGACATRTSSPASETAGALVHGSTCRFNEIEKRRGDQLRPA